MTFFKLFLKKTKHTKQKLKLPKKGLSKDEIIEYIVKFPILLQRPLISKYLDNKLVQTIIGRPPEKVLSLFD